MHAKLRVYKTITVGANLHCLISNVLIDKVFLTYSYSKNIIQGYAQHKGFSRFIN